MTDSGGSDPTSSRRLGRVLAGKWQLFELLGEGGAGAVYLATGPSGESVAVKVLHPELAAEPTVRARFVKEAYFANKIDHPGVVRVLEDGEDEEGLPYLVMELLDGETFEARLVRKGGKLPISEVLWLADRTLHVLTAAHKVGIVHRDIKPENLFLTRDRVLKVLDFGIARIADSRESTTMGTVLGTLAFMPPEQARGATNEIGVQSDLWSVGATMFTLLSGRLVRDDENVQKLLLEAGRTKVPSLSSAAPEVPSELVELVDYALSLEIKVRWPTAKMMRRAVRMVHGQIKRESMRVALGEDEDDGEVSEPSFGVIANRSIEPPPPSVGFPSMPHLRVAALAPPPGDLAGERSPPKPREARTTTLSSAESPPPSNVPAVAAPEASSSGDRMTEPAITVKGRSARSGQGQPLDRRVVAVAAAIAAVLLLTVILFVTRR